MNLACQRLIQHLDQRQIHYAVGNDNQSISTYIFGKVGDYRLVVQTPDESDIFQLFGYSPVLIPVGARPAIAEVIARVNHPLRLGRFTLDFKTGELAFHIAQLLNDAGPDADSVDWMICTTLAVMDKYLPAVLSVIYSNETPEDAVRRIDESHRPEEAGE